MRRTTVIMLFAAALCVCAAQSHADDQDYCTQAQEIILQQLPPGGESSKIIRTLNEEISRFESHRLARAFCGELVKDLSDKISSKENGVVLTPDVLLQHAILFESFRLETYLASGVAPKRFFGFFDEQGDTAAYERILRITTIGAVKIANEFAAEQHLNFRITEQEVAFTFLAEGGALLLTNPEYSVNRVHPVRGIGLDNFRKGFDRFPELVERLDRAFGTKLGSLVLHLGPWEVLLRPMTFREAVLGTTLMYLYEKELTDRMMAAEWQRALKDLPLPQQFIVTSLVYNCGLLFSYERVRQIEHFATGEYLAEVNKKSNRPKLAVYPRAESESRIMQGGGIPRQLTSWSAVYHILQRYGAWRGVELYSGTFKDGEYALRS